MDLRFVWQAWHLHGDIDLGFVWQAWHLATYTFTSCGRRGSYGTQLALVTRLVAADAVAGVALGDMNLHFVWQAWHLVTWTFTLCGRRGTYGTGLGLVTRLVAADAASFCVAGVALGDIDLRFVWQVWHLATSTFTLCGRRGTYGTGLGLVTRLVAADAASFCVAGVALGDMDFRFVWQACTWRHRPSFCVAGVALGDMYLHFVWQAWHLRHSAGSGDALGRRGRRGRRGTWRHEPALCVAGVALGDMDLHFVWQAWHLRHWAGLVTRLVAADAASFCVWHLVTWTFVLCGRRGTRRHRPSFCVAVVALGDINFTLCGRRGTSGTQLGRVTRLVAFGAASFCMAGVALGDMELRFVWQAWHLATSSFTLCGRRGTYGTQLGRVTRLVTFGAASFCVAGVALGDMELRFVWQSWHLVTSTFTLCGRLTALSWVV
eukprot:s610_g20.t1